MKRKEWSRARVEIPFSVSLSNTFSNGCIHMRDVLVNQTRTNAFRIIAASGNCARKRRAPLTTSRSRSEKRSTQFAD